MWANLHFLSIAAASNVINESKKALNLKEINTFWFISGILFHAKEIESLSVQYCLFMVLWNKLDASALLCMVISLSNFH